MIEECPGCSSHDVNCYECSAYEEIKRLKKENAELHKARVIADGMHVDVVLPDKVLRGVLNTIHISGEEL